MLRRVKEEGIRPKWDKETTPPKPNVGFFARIFGTRDLEWEGSKYIRQLQSDDRWVRRDAALTLGRMDDRAAIPELVKALRDWDAGPVAAESLEKWGWKPNSTQDQIYYWAAKKFRGKLWHRM